MFRRFLLIAALVLAAGSAAVAAPAGAQNYGGCSAAVSDTTPTAGQTVTVTGTGADAAGTVTAALGSTVIGSGTADADGAFSFSATVPTSATGSQTVSVDCGAGAAVAGVTLTVVAAAGGTIPRTGSSSTLPMTAVALVSLALGGLALTAARKRSNAAH